MISCSSCGLRDLLEFANNIDEVYLDFLTRFDSGKTPDQNQILSGLILEGIVRDEKEIKKMVGNNSLDQITESVLFSKNDYISLYRNIKEPAPQLGSNVDDFGLDGAISDHLQSLGIKKFYKFQEDAIKEISYGSNVVIEAPTASGKTEAFLIPVIQKIKSNKEITGKVFALFVYPTKSLSRDQYPKILAFAERLGISVNVFDGDTKQSERRQILDEPPQLIITNFDILHYHLLHQTKFASLLNSVRFLIVDEAHVYSGIFGSNVHYIIKRLKRICNNIQFVAASATLDNSKEFCEQLFGVQMKIIKGSGRKGETDFVMLFPSLRTQRALMIDLLKNLTGKKHKTMVFSNSHINSELLAIQAKRQKIMLQAISCTPTLELGIDVGDVDGVISATIPVNRLMQRIGRAARKGQRGYAFLALGNDPISQYYKNHPNDYFDDDLLSFCLYCQ